MRRRRDRHVRFDVRRAGRVRAGRPGSRADAPGHRARLRRAGRVLDTRPPALGGRLHGPGHQVPHAGADLLRRLPRRLRGAGARVARGRRRLLADRDAVRPPVDKGGHQRGATGHGDARPHRAAAGAGDDRTHRPHAAGHRGRCRTHSPRRHAGRRRRPQLRHRAGRDERGAAPPLGRQPRPHFLHPQCGAAVGRRRQDALRPHGRGPGRASAPVRHRVRGHGGGRLLRYDARAPGRGGRAVRRRGAGSAHAAARARGRLHLHLGAVQAGHVFSRRRRANQRQRFQGFPRGHAGRGLGHLRGHGPGPGARGLARDRRLRGLHRRRRRGRHDRGGQPALHPVDRPDHGRLHGGPGGARRVWSGSAGAPS